MTTLNDIITKLEEDFRAGRWISPNGVGALIDQLKAINEAPKTNPEECNCDQAIALKAEVADWKRAAQAQAYRLFCERYWFGHDHDTATCEECRELNR